MANVVIFEKPRFGGQSRTLGVGNHRLAGRAGLEDMVSSIRVPPGLVAMLNDDADASGPWGKYVDLLEDHAELASLGFDNKTSYIQVFPATNTITSRDHRTNPPRTVQTKVVWTRNAIVNGTFMPGHWERPRASGPRPAGAAVVSPDPKPPNVLHLVKLDGSAWQNPPFDTSGPKWSKALVDGHTFDGSSAHKFEWVSVLNKEIQQDDEVGLTGIALNPAPSGSDLPFTHPFGPDFEFGILPDPAYENLLAPENRNPDGQFADEWKAAHRSGLAVPAGVLGLEVDEGLVPNGYRFEHGDRIAIYGRWIVDAGHEDFHAEIHPPMLMARARFVDDNDQRVAPSADSATALQLWSRPYQANQLFATDGDSGLCLRDYAERIVETWGDVEAYPQLFPTPFVGVHIVNLVVDPPPQAAPRTPVRRRELRCSYHFVTNGSCGVQVRPAPTGGGVLVTLAFNAVSYPSLPELDRVFTTYNIDDLLAQAPGGVDLSWWQDLWLSYVKSDVKVRTYVPPVMPEHAGKSVVPFTPPSSLPPSRVVTDGKQSFPIFGWLKLKWFETQPVAKP